MTRLAGRLAQASSKELIRCHFLGVWTAVWVAVALWWTLPWIRTLSSIPLTVLVLATAIGGVVAALSVALSGPLLARSYAYPLVLRVVRRQVA